MQQCQSWKKETYYNPLQRKYFENIYSRKEMSIRIQRHICNNWFHRLILCFPKIYMKKGWLVANRNNYYISDISTRDYKFCVGIIYFEIVICRLYYHICSCIHWFLWIHIWKYISLSQTSLEIKWLWLIKLSFKFCDE